MSGVLEITVGAGRENPRAKCQSITYNGEGAAAAFANALRALPPVVDGWISLHSYRDNHRQEKKWQSTVGAMVDLDWHDGEQEKPPVPIEVRARLDAVARAGNLPGNDFHFTPHGARFFLLFPAPESDPTRTKRATLGACATVQAAIAELGLAEFPPARRVTVDGRSKVIHGRGFHFDSQAVDLARLMFGPRAIVDGEARDAEVIVMRAEPYTVDELIAAAPPEPAAKSTKQGSNGSRPSTARTDVDEAAAGWNAAHRLNIARHSEECPICGDDHSFGHLPDDDQRWHCFSTDHPDNVGVRGAQGVHGDALDLEAHRRGKSRIEVLREDGYLAPICGARTRNGKTCAATELFSDGRCFRHPASEEGKAERKRAKEREAAAPPADAGDRIPIKLGAEEAIITDAAIEALTKAPDLYQRGGQLVEIAIDEPESRGIKRSGSVVRIARCVEARVRDLLTTVALILVSDGGGGFKHAHPPQWLVRNVMGRPTWRGIRPLVAVAEAPTLRPDGSLLDATGYDPATGIYLASDLRVDLSGSLDRDAARRAVALLADVVSDFPFASPAAGSAWLAGLLSIVGRPAIDGPVPMVIVDASTRGAGKSLLVDVSSMIATGRAAARFVYSHDDKESRKAITALALVGDPVVLIDNVTGTLGDAALDAALTGTTWSDRKLGANEMTPPLPLRMVFHATGNGLTVGGDLSRRSLLSRLEPIEEHPENRTGFRYPRLLDHVRQRRGELLGAALTILRSYIAAGRPVQQVAPMGSFESWSDLVRNALIWAGAADPCKTISDLRAADIRTDAFRLVVQNWPVADKVPVTAADLVKRARDESGSWRTALEGWCPGHAGELPTVRKLGNMLREVRRRIIDGKALDFAGKGSSGAKWIRVSTSDCRDSSDCSQPPYVREPFMSPRGWKQSPESPQSLDREPGEEG